MINFFLVATPPTSVAPSNSDNRRPSPTRSSHSGHPTPFAVGKLPPPVIPAVLATADRGSYCIASPRATTVFFSDRLVCDRWTGVTHRCLAETVASVSRPSHHHRLLVVSQEVHIHKSALFWPIS